MTNFILVAFTINYIKVYSFTSKKIIVFFETRNISEQKLIKIRASDSQNYSIISRYKKLLRSLIYIFKKY